MFSKRRRAASNPPQRAPASASASLAATKAFVRDRESNPNLSNAAAAAALRTHVTTPTPVGDTVTKRMVRRNSASSNGSSAVNQQHRPGSLQRQSSSGSMTERTFRSPSPGRGHSPSDTNPPPVPEVPKNIPQTSTAHRRASSLDPPFRGGSPAPRGGGRGVSLDRGAGPSTGGRGQRVASNLSQVPEDDHDAAQRASINFSRPMSPASAAKSGWFGGPVVNQDAVQRMASTSRPSTSSGVPGADARNTQQFVQNAAARPVRTHQISHSVQGSRLSSGSMRAKPSGTAVESRSFLQPAPKTPSGPVDPRSPDAVFDPSTRTFVHKQDAMARHRELNEEPEQPVRQYVAQHVEEQRTPRVVEHPQQRPQQQPQPPTLPRTPSPVRQPAQREVSSAAQLPRIDTSARVRRPEDPPTGIPKQELHEERAIERPLSQHAQGATSNKVEDAAQPTPIDVMVSPKFATNQDSSYPHLPKSAVPTTTNTVAREGKGSVRTAHDRGQSLSPPRNAHFAPVAIELAGIKHQPPPRSISPAKSALKSSPSVSRRGNSPVAQNGRLLSTGAPSEASDTTSDGGSRKRRSIRVSFEENPVVAGASAYPDSETPTSPSGLAASKWSPNTEKDNEFEDFMRPRPALPSFGSIREKERRSPHEEVPEKVTETVSSTPMSASVGSVGEPLQSSSDHAIAGIVAQDLAAKHSSMNDPLPPEVTSVEGTGYVSDLSSDDDRSTDLQKHGAMDDSSQILSVPEPKSLTTPHEEKPSPSSSVKEQVLEIPNIALMPATPSPTEKPEPKFQSMTIPGGWDDDAAEPEKTQAPFVVPTKPVELAEPVHHPTTLQELIDRDEESSDDNSSIYSDAYEDLSDMEGGFASIDAMVESPVATSSGGLMFSKFADKSANEPTSSGLRNEARVDDTPEPVTAQTQEWDVTRQHWSGLHDARKLPQAEESTASERDHSDDGAKHLVAAPAKKEQSKVERRADAPVQNKPAPQSQKAQPTSKPLKSALKKTAVVPPTPAVQAQPQMRQSMRSQNPQNNQTSQPQMRTSMRGPPDLDLRLTDAPVQMRRSMRGVNPPAREQPQMRTSMRGSNTDPVSNTGLAASRHSMAPVEQKPARAALQKKHIPPATVAAKARPQSMPAAPVKPVASVPTYDSDSDASASSFQRARGRRNNSQGERYTMRASMRSGPAPTMRANAPAPKPVRSISPPGSPTPALRKSLRPSSPNPDPPKSSKFSIRSLSPMGRFRSSKPIEAAPPSPTQPKKKGGLSKQSKVKVPTPERAKPAFKSRFADSSDEDEDSRPSRFQSRFADSDDDEPADYTLPPGLAPVRGIPRKAGEEDGDSTDLEEEVDEVPAPAAQKEMSTAPKSNGVSNGQTNGTATGQGSSLTTGTLRDSKHAPLPSFEGGGKSKTKRGFFGLGKKKSVTKPDNKAQAATTVTDAMPSITAPPSEIPLPPQQRNRDQGLPLTPIDEDKDIGTPVQTSPQTKRSPKLQRRSTPEWPLPHNNIPVPPIPEDARPMSSDGIAPRRPRFAVRQSSQISNVTAPPGDPTGLGRSVSYGRSGKKKKFQGLRRVFGLND